jgi:hypothetical protein
MVHLPKPTVVTNSSNLFDAELGWGEAIGLESQEFTADRSDNLNLSPSGRDSGAIFVGVAHSGSPSLQTILEEFSDEDDSTSSEGGSSGIPIS